jgi:hypothetical protein
VPAAQSRIVGILDLKKRSRWGWEVTPATWVETAVAVATAAMAITTAYMASKTASAASATRDDAKASQRAAEAAEASVSAARDTLDEIRRGRELEWRPHLSITVPTFKVSGDDQVSFDFLAMNLGRGPALQCVCVYMNNRRGAVSGVFEVRPSDREQGHGQTDTKPLVSFWTEQDQQRPG